MKKYLLFSLLLSMLLVSCEMFNPPKKASSIEFETRYYRKTPNSTPFINTITGGEGDGKITFSTSNPDFATVDPDSGLVTTLAVGNVTITANKAETDDYSSCSANYAVYIYSSLL